MRVLLQVRLGLVGAHLVLALLSKDTKSDYLSERKKLR